MKFREKFMRTKVVEREIYDRQCAPQFFSKTHCTRDICEKQGKTWKAKIDQLETYKL